MFHFLGFLFIIIIAILLIGLASSALLSGVFSAWVAAAHQTLTGTIMEIINPEEDILSMADNSPALLPTKNLKQG